MLQTANPCLFSTVKFRSPSPPRTRRKLAVFSRAHSKRWRPAVTVHLNHRLGPLSAEDTAAYRRLRAQAHWLPVVGIELGREGVAAAAAQPAVTQPRVLAAREEEVC